MYIDETYLSNLMGAGILSGTLAHGGTPTASTGSVAAMVISGACSYVDTFLETAGYSVPLADYPPIVSYWSGLRATQMLYLRAGKAVPDPIAQAVGEAESQLLAVAQGTLRVPGASEDTTGAVAGGHTSSGEDESSSTTSEYAAALSRQVLNRVW